MSTELNEEVTVRLPKGTLLVLFEFLAHSYAEWKQMNEQSSNDTFVLLKPDPGERVALWHLEGQIERTVPEIFALDYKELIAEWKRKLTSD